ncbi:MAG: hypothetical protein CFK52_05800 [Chloracidobacterium sp. CP2_5A]|nr:MAG: hypothetical protein CFK52_05800 [Chloracidobacterium sp. CP2_5A]
MNLSPERRQLMAEAQALLCEAERRLRDLLDGVGDLEAFEVACDALNVAAVKLRLIQIELSAQEETFPEAAAQSGTARADDDDTLPPD